MKGFCLSMFAAATLVAGTAHAADLMVIQSDASAYVKGDVVDSDQAVQLAAGQKLVLQMPNGRSVTLRGPWDSKPVDEETVLDTSSATKYLVTPPQTPRHSALQFRGVKKKPADTAQGDAAPADTAQGAVTPASSQ